MAQIKITDSTLEIYRAFAKEILPSVKGGFGCTKKMLVEHALGSFNPRNEATTLAWAEMSRAMAIHGDDKLVKYLIKIL